MCPLPSMTKRNPLLPDCSRLYPRNNFVFQQDRAPSHTSRVTQGHLATPEFIKKDEWPPQSSDCNTMENAFISEKESLPGSFPLTWHFCMHVCCIELPRLI